MKISPTLFTGIICMASLGVMASPLSPEDALRRVEDSTYFPTRGDNRPSLIKTLCTTQQEPAVYIFSDFKDNGIMVVSADDNVSPLIGYSDGNFNINEIPDAFQYWLEEYCSQIEYLRSSEIPNNFNTLEITSEETDRYPIQPLVKTRWMQRSPYNNLCPEVNGVPCSAGCASISMAQTMKYFNYPEYGKSSIFYTTDEVSGLILFNFAQTRFDWENMLDSYASGNFSDTEATAVATLVKGAGCSVLTEYSPNGSAASSKKIKDALVSYFNYEKVGLEDCDRNKFSLDEWSEMIYNNLKTYGPVIYNGTKANNAGHSFICDGYKGNGYFHFNWGWGGTADGYFLLSLLNPADPESENETGGYNYNQNAIIGIRPLNFTNSISSVRDDGNIDLRYDRKNHEVIINSSEISSVMAYDINGNLMEIVSSPFTDSLRLDVKNWGNGIFVVAVNGPKGIARVFKIIL